METRTRSELIIEILMYQVTTHMYEKYDNSSTAVTWCCKRYRFLFNVYSDQSKQKDITSFDEELKTFSIPFLILMPHLLARRTSQLRTHLLFYLDSQTCYRIGIYKILSFLRVARFYVVLLVVQGISFSFGTFLVFRLIWSVMYQSYQSFHICSVSKYRFTFG